MYKLFTGNNVSKTTRIFRIAMETKKHTSPMVDHAYRASTSNPVDEIAKFRSEIIDPDISRYHLSKWSMSKATGWSHPIFADLLVNSTSSPQTFHWANAVWFPACTCWWLLLAMTQQPQCDLAGSPHKRPAGPVFCPSHQTSSKHVGRYRDSPCFTMVDLCFRSWVGSVVLRSPGPREIP